MNIYKNIVGYFMYSLIILCTMSLFCATLKSYMANKSSNYYVLGFVCFATLLIIWHNFFKSLSNHSSKQLSLILKNQKHIMATIEEVQQAVADLQSSVDTKQAAIAAAIKALEDQIAAGSAATPEQLQAVVDSLKATQADVDSTPTA